MPKTLTALAISQTAGALDEVSGKLLVLEDEDEEEEVASAATSPTEAVAVASVLDDVKKDGVRGRK